VELESIDNCGTRYLRKVCEADFRNLRHKACNLHMTVIRVINALLTIVLHFDGSWRPKSNSQIDGGIASCGACLLLVPNDIDEDSNCAYGLVSSYSQRKESESERDGHCRPSKNQVMVLGLGGKRLGSLCPSSSHAEYEGLLFGLRRTLDYFQQSYSVENMTFSSVRKWHLNKRKDNTKDHEASLDNRFIIRGDCSTVLAQLMGRSNPRKLRDEYKRSIDLIEQITQTLDEIFHDFNDERVPSNIFSISYELIPRDLNVLSDFLAREVDYVLSGIIFDRLRQDITNLETVLSASSNGLNGEKVDSLLKKIWFSCQSQSSPLSLTMQVNLLVELTEMLYRISDNEQYFTLLFKVASEICTISTKVSQKSYKHDIFVKGIEWQVKVLQRMKQNDAAQKLKRKHRYILANPRARDVHKCELVNFKNSTYPKSEEERICNLYSFYSDLHPNFKRIVLEWNMKLQRSLQDQEYDETKHKQKPMEIVFECWIAE